MLITIIQKLIMKILINIIKAIQKKNLVVQGEKQIIFIVKLSQTII